MRCHITLVCCLLVVGCGQSSETSPEPSIPIAGESPTETAPDSSFPVASIGSAQPTAPEPAAKADDYQSRLAQIQDLKAQLAPKGSVDELRAWRRARNEQIAAIAVTVVNDLKSQPELAKPFRTAVHELLEARLQMAIQGEKDDVRTLYSVVGDLEREFPGTHIASEGAIARIRLAHRMSQEASGNTDWIEEFSRLTRLYASNYPNDARNTVSLLFTAGRTCELNGLRDQAVDCFSMLKEQFADSRQGQQSFAILRRLNLPGQSLQFEGPTLNGKVVSARDLKGRVGMICYWSSKEPETVALGAKLMALHKKYGRYGLRTVGVNLDEDQAEVTAWLEQNEMPGPQVFEQTEQRRWESPIASYYGILDIPVVWLVNPDGTVNSTNVSADQLESEIRTMLTALRDAKAAAKAKTAGASGN